MYLILIFIILLLIKCSCVENYYTFFIPYKKTKHFRWLDNIKTYDTKLMVVQSVMFLFLKFIFNPNDIVEII